MSLETGPLVHASDNECHALGMSEILLHSLLKFCLQFFFFFLVILVNYNRSGFTAAVDRGLVSAAL